MSIEWRGAAVSPGDDVPSSDEWQDVTVPGRPSQFAGEAAVAYRADFEDPREGDEDHVLLVLHGLYAKARVWLNGDRLAEHDAYFEPLRLSLPVEDENSLVVECCEPDDRFGGIHDTDLLPATERVPGIWWRADVETHPDPFIESLRLTPRLTTDGAAVDVTARVVTDEPLDERVTLSLRPAGDVRGGGMMNRMHVDCPAGETTETATVEVRDPSLWWPADVGAQPRYTLRAKLGDTERTATTGLSEVTYAAASGFAVNGHSVRARGVNLLDATVEDVERAAEANATLVRAHAHALSPDVLAACDEHGLLVWQDLPLCGPGGFDVSRGTDLAERLVASTAHHPSVAALGIHDDPIGTYANGLGSGVLDRLRFRWRAWRASYGDTAANEIGDAVDDLPTFPVMGPPGIDPDAANVYPGWEFGDASDLDWVCDRYDLGDVVTEFGAGYGTDDDRDQADVVGRVAEGLRRRGAHAIAAYVLRDPQADGMGLVDGWGEPRDAYHRLAAAYRPVQAVLSDPTPGQSDVVVLHDRGEAATLTVEWDVDGEREQTELDVEAYGRVTVDTVSLSASDEVTLAVARDGSVTKHDYTI